MMTQSERIKQEIEELAFFTVKLLMHWFVLAVILGFVLVAAWGHQRFKKAFHDLEAEATVVPKAETAPSPTGELKSQVTNPQQPCGGTSAIDQSVSASALQRRQSYKARSEKP